MTDGNVTIQPETIVVGSGTTKQVCCLHGSWQDSIIRAWTIGLKEWDRQCCPHCLDRGKCRSEMSGLAQWHHVCDRCDIEWDSELPIDTGHDAVEPPDWDQCPVCEDQECECDYEGTRLAAAFAFADTRRKDGVSHV